MAESFSIKQLQIRRFRGIKEITWNPDPGFNLILGGGDCGKSTILDALGILFSPTSSFTLSEADYWMREVSEGFEIAATVEISADFDFSSGSKIFWPWEWNGTEAVQPSDEPADDPSTASAVFKIRVFASEGFELAWEIIQPDDSREHFSAGLRRKFGAIKLSGEEKSDRDLRLVYGSALDRLLSDDSLRSKISTEISKSSLKGHLSEGAKAALDVLDEQLNLAHLPHGLELGLTSSQGISIGALVGLFADKNGVSLPLSSWGAGTRRMSALKISAADSNDAAINLIDEIERGLEPYRLRQFLRTLNCVKITKLCNHPQRCCYHMCHRCPAVASRC